MKKYIKITLGSKLAILYLSLFGISLLLVHTIGYQYVRKMVLSESLVSSWSSDIIPLLSARVDYYFNVLLSVFYFLYAIVGLAFFGIYLANARPLHKLLNGAKKFSITRKNSPICVRSHDEYGELAQTLNVIAEELNSFDDYQRKFISNVSHDFRSPLTSIRGYVQAMTDGVIPPENQEKYLNIILFETNRLTKLTTDLLNVNNFGKNNFLLDISDFDIHAAIANTIDILEGSARNKNITFETELACDGPLLVVGDPDKIHQVLHNLLDNAIKFSHNDSQIFIRTRTRGERVFVSIKDTGIGIPKESLGRIWDRFYKTDLSRGRDKLGTGLGLSISKEIINAHRQTINVVSTVGVGSEFVFTLPKA